MTRYTLLNPFTGGTSTVAASELTHHMRVNHILLRGDEHIGIITHHDVVSFCRWCVEKTLDQRMVPPEVYPEVYTALGLVDKWLIDPVSASSEELKQAAAAADVAGSATWAAYAAGVSWKAQAQWLVEHLRSAQ